MKRKKALKHQESGTTHRVVPVLVSCLMLISSCSSAPPISFLQTQGSISSTTWEQIESTQELLSEEQEIDQLFTLAALYLQAIRESADPTLYEKIHNLMDNVRAQEPDNSNVLFFEAQIDLGRHHFSEALKKAERLISFSPNTARFYGVLADAQIELGQYEEAEQSLQTMIDLRPDFSAYSRIAYLREIYGDREGAIEMMELSVDSSGAIPENLAWSLTELGRLLATQDQERAAEAFQAALNAYPDYTPALFGLAKLDIQRKNQQEAVQTLEKSLSILPLPEYAILLGELYEEQGDQNKAEVYFKLVDIGFDRIEASGTDVRMERTLYHLNRGIHLEESLTTAQQLSTEKPTVFTADLLAWAHYKNGNISEAQQWISKALETGIQSPEILEHQRVITESL